MAGGRECPGAGGGDRGGGVKRTAPRALAAALLAVAGLVPSCGARTPLPSPEACEPIDLELVPAPGELDMYLMLDSSGSMEDPTLTGATKWVATTAALEEFFGSAQASGLGIALSYFPFIDPTVPELCGPTGNECGDPEDCILVGFCPESETLATYPEARAVAGAVHEGWRRWAPSFAQIFWIDGSHLLLGIKR